MAESIMKKINIMERWERSRFGRFCRWVIFKVGFSQCRYCIYCKADGAAYKGLRESILLNKGKCKWSEGMASGNLSYEDLRAIHRCAAFVPMLYNFKEYALDPEQVKEIMKAKSDTTWKWLGWIIAALALVVAFLNYKSKV